MMVDIEGLVIKTKSYVKFLYWERVKHLDVSSFNVYHSPVLPLSSFGLVT